MVAQLSFDEITEGTESSLSVVVSPSAIDLFIDLSGDVSPLHVTAEFARARGFHDRVVHGAYLGALVSRLIGTQLPGVNAIVQSMQLTFHKPTYIGDTVTVTGRLERKLDPLRAILVSVKIAGSGPSGGDRQVASGKVQVGFTG